MGPYNSLNRAQERDLAYANRTIKQLKEENRTLLEAIQMTLDENKHLADGEVCTLIRLKRVLPPNAELSDSRRAAFKTAQKRYE